MGNTDRLANGIEDPVRWEDRKLERLYVTSYDLASYLTVVPAAIREWQREGQGPVFRYRYVSGRVNPLTFYLVSDIRSWLSSLYQGPRDEHFRRCPESLLTLPQLAWELHMPTFILKRAVSSSKLRRFYLMSPGHEWFSREAVNALGEGILE